MALREMFQSQPAASTAVRTQPLLELRATGAEVASHHRRRWYLASILSLSLFLSHCVGSVLRMLRVGGGIQGLRTGLGLGLGLGLGFSRGGVVGGRRFQLWSGVASHHRRHWYLASIQGLGTGLGFGVSMAGEGGVSPGSAADDGPALVLSLSLSLCLTLWVLDRRW